MDVQDFKPNWRNMLAIARGIEGELLSLAASGAYDPRGALADEKQTILGVHDMATRASEVFAAIITYVDEHVARDPDFKTVDARRAFEMKRMYAAAPAIVTQAQLVAADLERKCPDYFRGSLSAGPII